MLLLEEAVSACLIAELSRSSKLDPRPECFQQHDHSKHLVVMEWNLLKLSSKKVQSQSLFLEALHQPELSFRGYCQRMGAWALALRRRPCHLPQVRSDLAEKLESVLEHFPVEAQPLQE